MQLGQLWAIGYKKATNQLLSLRCLKQKQGTAHDPSTQHHDGGGQIIQASRLLPHPGTWPVLPSKGLSSSSPGASKNTCSLSLPHAAAWTPAEVCLPVTNFYWLKSPRAQVSNREASVLSVVSRPGSGRAQTPGSSHAPSLHPRSCVLLPLGRRGSPWGLGGEGSCWTLALPLTA